MDAQPIEVSNVSTPVKSYSHCYLETDWGRLLCPILKDHAQAQNRSQLSKDMHRTCNVMPHAYLTIVKDERCLVLLYHMTHHATVLGARSKPWKNKVLIFTGDAVETQALRSVFLPPLLLATV